MSQSQICSVNLETLNNWVTQAFDALLLKRFFTNFEYITFFSCPNKRNIFYKRSMWFKQFWFEIIEKIWCSKSVRLSTVIYILYITPTDFEHHFSQLFRVRVVLSKWTFYKKCFFWDTKKICYSQKWWAIPLNTHPK